MKLDKLVRSRREELGLSLRGVAGRCSVSFSAVARIERGETIEVSVLAVREIAKGLGLRPEKVFFAALETLERQP